MVVFEERGKPKYPEKNLSDQGREPTTNSTSVNRHMTPGPGIEPRPYNHYCYYLYNELIFVVRPQAAQAQPFLSGQIDPRAICMICASDASLKRSIFPVLNVYLNCL